MILLTLQYVVRSCFLNFQHTAFCGIKWKNNEMICYAIIYNLMLGYSACIFITNTSILLQVTIIVRLLVDIAPPLQFC